MHTDRVLYWDPDREVFTHNDTESNGKLSRPQRAPYGTDAVLAKAGLTT
jgi:hypothetical protein